MVMDENEKLQKNQSIIDDNLKDDTKSQIYGRVDSMKDETNLRRSMTVDKSYKPEIGVEVEENSVEDDEDSNMDNDEENDIVVDKYVDGKSMNTMKGKNGLDPIRESNREQLAGSDSDFGDKGANRNKRVTFSNQL